MLRMQVAELPTPGARNVCFPNAVPSRGEVTGVVVLQQIEDEDVGRADNLERRPQCATRPAIGVNPPEASGFPAGVDNRGEHMRALRLQEMISFVFHAGPVQRPARSGRRS